MSNYDWVFWPNVTNIALGVIVVLAQIEKATDTTDGNS